jgi:proline iminopeptidase
VISGRYDRVTPPSVAQAIFDGLTPGKGRLYIFERSAHRPWAEQPDEYFEVVGRFLN